MTYADIIVDISHEKLDKSFQYLVPAAVGGTDSGGNGGVRSLLDRGNHVRKGYVVGLSSKPKVDRKLYQIHCKHCRMTRRPWNPV